MKLSRSFAMVISMQDKEKYIAASAVKPLKVDSFHRAQRMLKLFNDATIEGPMPLSSDDSTPAMVYRTITTSTHGGALFLLANALKMLSPRASLMTNTDDETVMIIPAEMGTRFPMHQLERALDHIRDDLLNAISQRSDGSSILETEKFKYLSPDDGIHLIATLYRSRMSLYPSNTNAMLQDSWELPKNTRFINSEGELHTAVDHKTYQQVMAHRATVDGAAMTEPLPQLGGKYIEMDKGAYASLVLELGTTDVKKSQIN